MPASFIPNPQQRLSQTGRIRKADLNFAVRKGVQKLDFQNAENTVLSHSFLTEMFANIKLAESFFSNQVLHTFWFICDFPIMSPSVPFVASNL